MREYQIAYQDFSTDLLERRVLKGRLAEGLNACFECCDRWSGDGRLALEWISRDFVPETVTFRALQDAAGRFANLLRSYDIGAGDVVAGLLPRIPRASSRSARHLAGRRYLSTAFHCLWSCSSCVLRPLKGCVADVHTHRVPLRWHTKALRRSMNLCHHGR
jgi:hypothetical protein